jgi:hypothetical protein
MPDIDTFLDRYRHALESLDVSRIAEFWDPADQSAIYIAEEIAEPMIGFDPIMNYWARNGAMIQRLRLRFGKAVAHHLADDLTVCLYALHWDIKLKDGRAPIGGDVWSTAIIRWRTPPVLVHYAESALGPMAFMRKAFESAVSPDFGQAEG